jgi:hypothetical protein
LSVLVDGEEVINGGALALLGVLPSLRRIRDAVAAKVGGGGRRESAGDGLGEPPE